MSYLTAIACHCVRYRFTRLLFEVGPIGDMFQQKIDEISKDVPNVFGIADDILIVGYNADGRDHDKTLKKVIKICH